MWFITFSFAVSVAGEVRILFPIGTLHGRSGQCAPAYRAFQKSGQPVLICRRGALANRFIALFQAFLGGIEEFFTYNRLLHSISNDPFVLVFDPVGGVFHPVPSDHTAVGWILNNIFDTAPFKSFPVGRFQSERVQMSGNIKETHFPIYIFIKDHTDNRSFFRNDNRRLATFYNFIAKWRSCLVCTAGSVFFHATEYLAG